ncbi:MAG TPA: type I-U CRISPR-associated protein Cas7 [Bryobacteraceae bacterium]|nr:type I-U CRISPR-associated protein Cas7 [Bryobacteraceae bacterium]
MTNDDQSASTSSSPLPFTFGGFTIPAGCRRIFITAELEPSNGDPRIQPTGFPDIGPVLYADPAERDGLICLIESEASMANRLEEVCMENKYEGTLKPALEGLPYMKAQTGNGNNAIFKTASTLDGHRFASDFLAKGRATFGSNGQQQTLAEYIKTSLGMASDGSTMPIARIPDVFPLVFELDVMSLIHGFQVSNEQIKFVGLRLPRALTGSIIGLQCQRVTVPGVKFNFGQLESDSGQAIFQKQRITAKKIEARFSIDVGLLSSLRLDAVNGQGQPGQHQIARFQMLVAIALWKVAAFLKALEVELSLRTECKLRLKRNDKGQAIAMVKCEPGGAAQSSEFPFTEIAGTSLTDLILGAGLPQNRSPLTLEFGS